MNFSVNAYQPPFPYFGGKSVIASTVWQALGDTPNYIEPFFGSGAVLFMRPGGAGKIETVNDADGFVANFWRALKCDLDAVAEHADQPVNECDLHARHLWLIGQREDMTARLCGDPDWFDAKAAGWWVWGQCCWIAGGWCTGEGPWQSVNGEMVRMKGDAGRGVSRTLPDLGPGRGVNRKLPHLGPGQGVNRKLPHLANAGRGVNRKRPHLANAGRGERAERRAWLNEYLGGFADRLRNVRVCCGDWSRICGPTPTIKQGLTGVFLDPPYSTEADRDMRCYAVDCGDVAHDVRKWAIEQGSNPLMRIVLCGYEGEHAMPDDWRVIEWKTRGGYGSQGNSESRGKANRHRERLWLSPHCLRGERGVFEATA